jgi:hypothetical protein
MSIMAKRLEALEAAAVKAEGPEKLDVIRVIIDPDQSIVKALRRAEGGALVPVSVEELEEIRRGRE